MLLTVPTYLQANFIHRVERMSRKADKMGFGRIDAVAVREAYSAKLPQKVDGEWIDRFVEVQDWELQGQALEASSLRIEGWDIVAKIEYFPDLGDCTVNVFGDHEAKVMHMYNSHAEEHGRANQPCEHCSTNRRRNCSFILFKEDEGYKRVGSTCVNEFLGINHKHLIWLTTTLSEIQFDCEQGMEGRYCGIPQNQCFFDVFEYLCNAMYYIEKDGRIITKRECEGCDNEVPTWRLAMQSTFERNQFASDEQADKVDAVMASVLEQDVENLSAFDRNLRIFCDSERVHYKHLAQLIHVLKTTYETPEKDEKGYVDAYLGNEGDKLKNVKVTVERLLYGGFNDYGYSTTYTGCYLMRTEDGHAMKWKTNKDIDAGDELLITSGKIKECSEYKGLKQTTVTNCRVIYAEYAEEE